MTSLKDKDYMKRAIALAKKGEGWVNPNPMVGAVIVKDGIIIGEGYHKKYGQLHAEREALKNATSDVSGATMFVTLEPCNHHGKQPPCTEAIIEAGIKKVVVGSDDPNKKVAGKGIKRLREAGITVETGFMKKDCDSLNPSFFHYITTQTPYVTLKYAMTADGKIATKTGESKWITGPKARAYVHKMRHKNMAILTGIGTVIADDPLMNARTKNARNPVRVICDSKLRIPLDTQIVKTAKDIETIVYCVETKSHSDKISRLAEMGIEVIVEQGKNEKINLRKLLSSLGTRGIDSCLVECGGALADNLIRENLVDEICVFMAPKIFGGVAKTPVEGEGILHPDNAYLFTPVETKKFDDDIMIRLKRR